MVTHASGHMGAVNSWGCSGWGGKGHPGPGGGFIGRWEDGSPNGYLEEAAFTNMGSCIPGTRGQPKESGTGSWVYFSQGITTIHEGLGPPAGVGPAGGRGRQGAAAGDVAAYVDIKDSAALLEAHRDWLGAITTG